MVCPIRCNRRVAGMPLNDDAHASP